MFSCQIPAVQSEEVKCLRCRRRGIVVRYCTKSRQGCPWVAVNLVLINNASQQLCRLIICPSYNLGRPSSPFFNALADLLQPNALVPIVPTTELRRTRCWLASASPANSSINVPRHDKRRAAVKLAFPTSAKTRRDFGTNFPYSFPGL
jgi:hypothetical protein